ncbi:Sporulenol synthase [termite gut metagenome]|uniref:Sporulenol synthase n=1 Tax=termite gut metagenome TaxID=433724 RepID=A0A5J4RQ32_9ZZZZ
MIQSLEAQLIAKQSPDGMWRGELSPSAVSTSVSIFALWMIDKERYVPQIRAGADWLCATMTPEGSWGDSVESKSNLTATLLSYAALLSLNRAPEATKSYMEVKFGGIQDKQIVTGILEYYGKDLTFSAPILVMCGLAGVITDWEAIPRLPFELSVVPQQLFRFLRLPVVSYAIPALIAVGILRHRKGKRGFLYGLRESFVEKSLQVLKKLQPSNGGFLEAAPLTGFVAMCMCGARYTDHVVTQKAAAFLVDTVRKNGAWPIDTNLAGWLTYLSVKALGEHTPNKELVLANIKRNAFTCKHPFTGAKPGGWGWTNLPGAVPDADDTAGNLIALHILQEGKYCLEAERGIQWLLDLQNRDGGMPTFCKGWGKLPFDRSSPDITAHCLTAFRLWFPVLPKKMQCRCRKSLDRMFEWIQADQNELGGWTPLWFGDQDSPQNLSPVYGTAVCIDYNKFALSGSAFIATEGLRFLIDAQNEDGGWGGNPHAPSKVTLTAKTLSALSTLSSTNCNQITRGVDYLYKRFREGTLLAPEPIGLYFASLWYSEELYSLTFTLSALKQIHGNIIKVPE